MFSKYPEHDYEEPLNNVKGLWKGEDQAGIDLLVRIRNGYRSDSQGGGKYYVLTGNIVSTDPIPGFSIVDSFPRVLKIHVPSKDLYFLVEKVHIGRKNKEDFVPISLKGNLSRTMYPGGTRNMYPINVYSESKE